MLVVGAGQNQYNLYNSLRFRASASAYLNRTPTVGGNLRTWTASFWYKNGAIDSNQTLFSNATASDSIGFRTNRVMEIYFGAGSANLVTTQVFRDVAAWYHIVVAVDTTQATAANRIKMYVNGTQVTAFSTATYPAQNYDTSFNKVSTAQNIGRRASSSDLFLDGYMAEINWVDGLALPPTEFATLNPATGVGTPLKYAGTYGTNGFYLPFSDTSALTTSSNVGLGKDFSGNGNYWATNNISITAGSTYDAMTDVPTLTSATVANYAVMNPVGAVLAGGGTNMPNFAEANLRLNGGSAVWRDSGVSTINMKSGKWYIETTVNTLTGGVIIGLIDAFNAATVRSYRSNATKYINATNSAYGSSYGAGNVVGLAIDCDGGTLTCYVDNVSQGALCTDLVSAMPTNGWFYNPQIYSSSSVSVNFGQRPFSYTPPSGYNRLNTFNLPDSAIVQGNKVMDATLYTGTGALQNIVNAGSMQPDLVWAKSRSNTNFNNLMDSVRGTNKDLYSNSTAAEDTNAQIYTAINSNGFSVGTDNSANQSGQTFVGWQWQAGKGSTSSNTSGSITSTVSVNATAGFSVVTFTGNGTNGATIGHGLGVAPRWVIVKRRNSSVDDWLHYHISLGATQSIAFDTGAAITSSTRWNNTTPSSTLITLGTSTGVNGSGATYVAYCWAEIAGFSAFGSYTGNGSTDGPFVYLGFRPKYVLLKRTNSTGDWETYDTSRDLYNPEGQALFPNLSSAESSISPRIDLLSNGFKLRTSGAGINGSGSTYIYAAFAENPFKNALAR